MAEEEVLGENEATQEESEDSGGALDIAGGLLDSSMVKILLWAIGIVAVVFLVVGVTYWTIQSMYAQSAPRESNVSKEQPGIRQTDPYKTFDLEQDFIITKQDPRTGRNRTLKIHMVLAYNSENAAVQGELKSRQAQIRDLIYGVLGRMNVEDLSYNNKQNLQDKLVSEINKILTSGNRIQDVYFSDYVYQ